MAGPAVVRLLQHWGANGHALAPADLLAVQRGLMLRFLAAPREHAIWYGALGINFFVISMLVSAFALRLAAKSRSSVFAYHEIIALPDVAPAGYDASRCDVVYRGTLSPDFYGWVFPHGKTLSIGTGSADKGFPSEARWPRCGPPPA